MFEYIFDYQQRLALEDNLNLKELTLLFYLAKKILFAEPQQQFRNFTYREIISDVPILELEQKQIGRLINRLYALNYIKLVKSFGSFSVALTKKYYNILSPRHINDKEVVRYFFASTWSPVTKLEQKERQTWSSMTNSLVLDNNIITKNIILYILDEKIKTITISNTSNINIGDNPKTGLVNNIKCFFKLFNKIEIDSDLDLAKYNLTLLIEKVRESRFLRQFEKLSQLLRLYDNIINDKYKDFFYRLAKEDTPKPYRAREYTDEELNSLFDNLDDVEL